MKKRGLTWLVFVLAILSVGFAIAGSAEHVNDINRAFNCLDGRIEATSLSLEESVFAALAKTPNPKVNLTINQQKSSSESCWPSSGCTVKATSQAVLAKIRMGENVSSSVSWLKAKGGVTQQMTWYLQTSIDSNEPATCVINYDDADHSISIGEDMKLSGTLGSCLTIVPSGYWLKMGNNCLDKEFSVQCDKDFKTNLLYEKETGGTIYVSSQTHGASASAWTTEKIIAKCFKEGGSCSYEGSLWAASALYASGEDISEYAPYLRALAVDNEKYFPSAFLVAIYEGGDEHYAKIIDSERARPEGAYWQMPSSPYGKFYDSALAMLALGGADSPEIDNAKTLGYLFTNQDENGCWGGGNIRDTAFIIYAAQWPRGVGSVPIYECGDGIANGGEACDGTDLRNENCTSKDSRFNGGQLGCVPANASNECTYNTSLCTTNVPFVPVCKDGMINGSEVCDCGTDGVCTVAELNGKTCTTYDANYAGGTLGCSMEGSTGCLTFNVSQCYTGGGPPPGGNNGTTNQTNGTGGGGNTYDPNLLTDCELAGLFCVPTMWACQDAGGNYFPQNTHACNSFQEYCCTVDVAEVSCTSLSGTVCQWDAPCTSQTVESSDGPCCVAGVCEEGSAGCTSNDDCPAGKICNLGICETQVSSQCNDDGDCSSGQECKNGSCVTTSSGGGSNLWIWIVVLLILIVLVVLGMVFRDKIRVWWYQFRGKAKSSKIGPGGPPSGAVMARRPPPRFGSPAGMRPVIGGGQIVRPGMRPSPARQEPKGDKDKEAEETLKKLKEMSK